MKLIHCADLHLDSNMNTYLSDAKAKERKNELLEAFGKMIQYALDNDVYGIIIAGDLFDKKNISATARNAVMNAILNNENLQFYYLRGNHDVTGFWGDLEELPDNLHIFGTEWTGYVLMESNERRVMLTGAEFDGQNTAKLHTELSLKAEDYNIVVLHGQESENSKKGAEIINLRELKNRFIDYLALGHIHSYKEAELDARGVYCYSGCLSGRGFDECGEHGFVLINIDDNDFSAIREFVTISGRNLYELEVDVTGLKNSVEIAGRIKEIIENCCYSNESLVKIILTGDVDVECDINMDYLNKKIEDEFYYTRIKDKTGIKIDFEAFVHDESLKGEFVRRVKEEYTLTEEEKAKVIRYGILALRGEEL